MQRSFGISILAGRAEGKHVLPALPTFDRPQKLRFMATRIRGNVRWGPDMLVIYHRSGIWKKNRGCSLNLWNNKRICMGKSCWRARGPTFARYTKILRIHVRKSGVSRQTVTTSGQAFPASLSIAYSHAALLEAILLLVAWSLRRSNGDR